MMISELRISVTHIDDAKALGDNEFLNNIFSLAKEIVQKGGSIVIEQCFENAPSIILAKYSKIQEVEEWKKHLKIN